jgi:hypothetical protein
MRSWHKTVWWLSALAAVGCLLALTQTAQTGSRPAAHGTSAGPEYFTLSDEAHSGMAYGVTEDGRTVIYSREPSDR